jgi:hypothetical protein
VEIVSKLHSTRTWLLEKDVNFLGDCVLCDTKIEDSMHIFMSCNINKQVWYKTGLSNMIQQSVTNNNNMAKLVFSILQVLSAEQSSILATTIWSMWQSRNNKLWRNQTETMSTVYNRACTILTEWQMAQAEHKKSSNRQQQQQQQQQQQVVSNWIKPSLGRYKCNIDASFSPGLNKVGIDTCIRDDQGNLVLAKTEWFSPIFTVELGEAQGLLLAFNWVRDLQLENVDFELDALIVVMKFHSKNDDISELGDIIKKLSTVTQYLL